jgi:hypothetical protein
VHENLRSSSGSSSSGIFSDVSESNEAAGKIDVCLKLANASSNQMGIPLPAGRMRVYKPGPDGVAEFIGEDVIDHTAKDEAVTVRMGKAFDIVGTRGGWRWGRRDFLNRFRGRRLR